MKSLIALFLSLVAASCAHAPSVPPSPPAAPDVVFDNPICSSCGYLLEEGALSQEKARASAGDKDAAFRVYLHYVSTENRQERAVWLQRAAELGHPTAQYNMWFDLRNSEHCSDRTLALSWLEKSAAQGDASASRKLDAYRLEVAGCNSTSSLRPNQSFKPTPSVRISSRR